MLVFDAGRHGLTPRLGGRRQKSAIQPAAFAIRSPRAWGTAIFLSRCRKGDTTIPADRRYRSTLFGRGFAPYPLCADQERESARAKPEQSLSPPQVSRCGAFLSHCAERNRRIRLCNQLGAKACELLIGDRPRFLKPIKLLDLVGSAEADDAPQLFAERSTQQAQQTRRRRPGSCET